MENITIESILALGATLVDSEIVDESIDGGYWNEYSETWELGDFYYYFTVQGDEHGTREGYEYSHKEAFRI